MSAAMLLGVPLEDFAEFARKAATEGAALLKNEKSTLPIQAGEHTEGAGISITLITLIKVNLVLVLPCAGARMC